MRIITRKRIYRAFPELDHLSDFQCKQLMRRIRLSVWRLLVIVLAAVVAFFISFVVFTLLASILPDLIEPLLWSDDAMIVVFLVLAIGAVVLPLILALLTRDIVLGAFLKHGMRVYLRHTTCPGCGYQLLGQTVDGEGAVRCPECGRATTLTELGLDDPADLLPPRAEDA
jgi:hypothetical protein